MGEYYFDIRMSKSVLFALILVISYTHGYPRGFIDFLDDYTGDWWKDQDQYQDQYQDQNQYQDEDQYQDQNQYQEDDTEKKSTLPKDGELFEGDMIMDQRLRDAVLGIEDRKRSALASFRYLWPKGIVPYQFHHSMPSDTRDDVNQAIKDMAAFTCVRYVKRKAEKDFVSFQSYPTKCSSQVGRKGGQQNITIGEGCTREGTILHEMMHTIGIIHEQSRADRDDHVIVVRSNIKKKFMHNFDKYDFGIVRNLDTRYNFASIMHYGNDAFSKNDKPTLVSIEEANLKFGQRDFFSEGDVNEINNLYRCKDSRDTIGIINNENDASGADSRRLVDDHY